jgi:hypothetical protein
MKTVIKTMVFTWLFPKDLLMREMGSRQNLSTAIHFAAKYLIPLVLFTVSVFRVVMKFDFQGWHWIPGVAYIGQLGQGLTLLVFAVVFVLSVILINWNQKRRS